MRRKPAPPLPPAETAQPTNDSARLVPALLDQVRCIRLETVIVASIGDCFDLSLSVDAHTASMRGSGERAIGGLPAER